MRSRGLVFRVLGVGFLDVRFRFLGFAEWLGFGERAGALDLGFGLGVRVQGFGVPFEPTQKKSSSAVLQCRVIPKS